MRGIIYLMALALTCLGLTNINNKDLITTQFQRLQGEWEGILEYTDYSDEKTLYSLIAQCTTKFEDGKWIYEVVYEESNGEIVSGGGEFSVNIDGTLMDYNGIQWDVNDISQSGDTVKINMSTHGKDNRKKAMLRQTMEITSTTFIFVEEVKYDSGGEYFVRNRHLFRKKK